MNEARPNTRERVAWFNGEIVPESEVRISFRDRGWLFGDTAFDVARTFDGKPFKLREHVARLYRSLAYARIDPGLGPDEMVRVTEEVIEANEGLRAPGGDYWVGQRISRGLAPVDGEPPEREGATIVVDCTPLPLCARARAFRDGLDVVVPSVRRTPPESLSPRAKLCNYLNLVMGDLEAKARDPDAWAVLLDVHGNLAEGLGSNLFLVSEGAVLTPREDFVLPGVTRATVIELARGLDIPVAERDLSLFDAYTAEEAFLTSTSLCVCPVRSINGHRPSATPRPGPVTARITAAFVDLVGFDFVGQHLAHL